MLIHDIANQVHTPLVVLDQSFHIQVFNNASETLFNLSQKDVIGQHFDKICQHNKMNHFFNEKIAKVATKEKTLHVSSIINNEPIDWQVDVLTENQAIFYLIKGEDLKVKAHQNEIYQYQTLIENMPCNVYWVDKDFKMIDCNQNVLDMLNMKREEFRGKTYDELAEMCDWQKGLSDKLKGDDLSVMQTGKAIIGKEDPPLPHANGSFSNFLTSRVPLKNKNGDIVGIAGISTDVTALKKARAEAESASKTKSEFIANMSHDIRTPLSGIIGMSDILIKNIPDNSLVKYAQYARNSAKEMLRMLTEILEMAAADNIKETKYIPETFDLHVLLERIYRICQASTEMKKLTFKKEISPNLPRFIISDYRKIFRILMNFLTNAIKFTKEGEVCLGAELTRANMKFMTLSFYVKDTGIGIPKDKQKHVFDKLYRVNPSHKGEYKGFGIGLNIVKSFTHILHGKITLESELGQGTKLTLRLGVQEGNEVDAVEISDETLDFVDDTIKNTSPGDRSPKPDKNLQKTTHKSLSGYSVLLVEDSETNLKANEYIVTEAGCQYISATTGEDALEQFKSNDVDLVITDLGLPGISGFELASLIRKWETKHNKKRTPIVTLSAHDKYDPKSVTYGVDHMFTKPLEAETMNNILNKIIKDNNSTSVLSIEKQEPKKQNNTLGEGLPETEQALFDLTSFKLLDPKEGLKVLGGNIGQLSLSLKEISQKDIPEAQKELKNAYSRLDWTSAEKTAHRLKGSSLYTGTVRLKFACQYLERYFKAGHTKLLEKLYEQLLFVAGETKQDIDAWLAKYKL